MPKPQVTISVRKVSNATAVLDIQGEVTGFAEDVLMDAYNRASEQGARSIALNFGRLD